MAARARAGLIRAGDAIGTTAATLTANPINWPLGVTETALKVCARVPSPFQGKIDDAASALAVRNDFQKVVSWVVAGALLAAIPGELLFAFVLKPEKPDAHEARPALFVFGALAVASYQAWRNMNLAKKGGELSLRLPPSWVPWVVLGVTLFVGWLIGRTIFR